MGDPLISVVVPVYNEAENITKLHDELQSAVSEITPNYEIIYVNDGSSDGSLRELRKLDGVVIIDLQRNYGQATALDAGFKSATGQYIVSLDSDGQNDPKDIRAMYDMLRQQKLDVVAGWRVTRQDSGQIKFITRAARFLRKVFIKDVVHDSGCTLRVYTKEAVKSLDIGGEMHRFILALLRWKGFKIGEMPVNHRARMHGTSKYTASKAIRGLIDLVYIWFIHKYSQRPLHLFGYVALASFTLGAGTFCWSVYGKLAMGLSLNRNGWFFLSSFFLLAGIIFFSFGIVIDLLIRIHLNSSPFERRYYVRSISRSARHLSPRSHELIRS
jgi:glycosyltransferase involved in cell wall biosynthesis